MLLLTIWIAGVLILPRASVLLAGRAVEVPSVDEIASHLDVDSIVYLELENLVRATRSDPDAFCTACLTGTYPTEVPLTDSKFLLEHPS